MRSRFIIFTFLFGFLSLSYAPQSDAGGTEYNQQVESPPLRNVRYCEILKVAFSGWTQANIEVYNTTGLNDCPDALWKSMSVDQIRKQTGAMHIILNGPRYWLMDKIVGRGKKAALLEVNGLQFRKLGDVGMGYIDLLFDAIRGRAFYIDRQVQRSSVFVYNTGRTVHELIDPSNRVFVMQTFSVQIRPEQTEDSLENLKFLLNLPQGWTFRSRILTEPLLVKAVNNLATVIQDEFQNTYQWIEPEHSEEEWTGPFSFIEYLQEAWD